MNHCKIVEDLLPLYLDNLVSPETDAYLTEHLEGCPACAALHERMKVPAPEPEPVSYKRPLWRSVLKIGFSAIATWTALILFFGYLMWECGWFAEHKVMEAPDGSARFDVIYMDGAGFLANSGAFIETPEGRGRQYTGDEDFVDCHVWWAPNSEYYFLWLEFTDHDLTSYWGYDGPETYEYEYGEDGNVTGWRRSYDDRFFPRDESFFETMTQLLRPELESGWETIEFSFGQWREDSMAFSLSFETNDAQTGTVWFSIQDNSIICVT